MNTVDPETVLEAARWRYATKKFDPTRKIDPAVWAALEELLILSPSSFGLQPWKFLVVETGEIRERLLAAAWGQRQVVDASHLVVFAVKHPLTAEDVHQHILRTAEVQSIPVEQLAGLENVIVKFLEKPSYPLDVREWSTRQLYIAMGNFMTSAALLGIDTCPMEGLDPATFDQILGLEGSGYFTAAACPAGYRAADCKQAARPKVRFPASRVLAHL